MKALKEFAENIKSLTEAELAELNEYLAGSHKIVPLDGGTSDPLPPDPTHPHG